MSEARHLQHESPPPGTLTPIKPHRELTARAVGVAIVVAALMGAAEGQVGSGEQPVPAQETAPGNTAEGQAQGAGPMTPPAGGPEVQAQTMIKGGEAQNRLMFNQSLPQGGEEPA